MGDETFAVREAEGQSMSLAQALSYALEIPSMAAGEEPTSGSGGRTTRVR
jgi:hypothetical protein